MRFFLGERRSRLYPHLRAKFGRDPMAGSKKLPFKFNNRLGVRSLANGVGQIFDFLKGKSIYPHMPAKFGRISK